ncbi:MAG: hypothetical protein ACYDBJ_29325 [Aggregatilineales bacterium]
MNAQEVFNRMMTTESALEFLAAFGCALQTPMRPPGLAVMSPETHFTRHDEHGYGVELTATQNIVYQAGTKQLYQREVTHRFTLYTDGTLVWQMLGQPAIVGLKNVQGAFGHFRDALHQTELPEYSLE